MDVFEQLKKLKNIPEDVQRKVDLLNLTNAIIKNKKDYLEILESTKSLRSEDEQLKETNEVKAEIWAKCKVMSKITDQIFEAIMENDTKEDAEKRDSTSISFPSGITWVTINRVGGGGGCRDKCCENEKKYCDKILV